MTDPRDGQSYCTVDIGSQTWMAENLNYVVYDSTQSWCFDNMPEKCAQYGRLYSWSAAVNAYPDGWHLSANGEDAFGFTAIPAGFYYGGGAFSYENQSAVFWTSTELDEELASRILLYYEYVDAKECYYAKYDGFSVHYIKD